METYSTYKGFGITYSSIIGNTEVVLMGIIQKTFVRCGEAYGKSLAKEYIDSLI